MVGQRTRHEFDRAEIRYLSQPGEIEQDVLSPRDRVCLYFLNGEHGADYGFGDAE